MTTLYDSAVSVKPSTSFGRGIDRRPIGPTEADLDWAAAFFGQLEDARLRAEENAWYEERAQEAEWLAKFDASIPAQGHCLACGDYADLTPQGLCDACDLVALERSSGMR
jgi:hypothetical protein